MAPLLLWGGAEIHRNSQSSSKKSTIFHDPHTNSRVYLLLGAPVPNKMMNTTISRWYASGGCGGRMGWGHINIIEPYLAITHGHLKRENYLPFFMEMDPSPPESKQQSTIHCRNSIGSG